MRRYNSLILLLTISLSVFSDVTIKVASGARGIIMSIASTDSKIVGAITSGSSELSVKLTGIKNVETFNGELPKYIASGGLIIKNSSDGVLLTLDTPSFNKDAVVLKSKGGELFLLLSREPSTEFIKEFTVSSMADNLVEDTVAEVDNQITDTEVPTEDIVNTEESNTNENFDGNTSDTDREGIASAPVILNNLAVYNRDGMEYLYFYGENIIIDSVLNTPNSSTVFFAKENFKNSIGNKELDECFLSKSIKFIKNKCTININNNGNFVYITNLNKDVVLLLFSDNREKKGEIISVFDGKKSFSGSLYNNSIEKESENNVITDSVILIKDNVNIRSTPNTSSKDNIIGSFEVNRKFSIISKDGDWYKIDVDGKDGWIFNSLCKIINQDDVDSTLDMVGADDLETSTTKILYLIKDNVNFRSTPKSGSNENIIGKYPLGTRLELIKKANGWCFVNVDDKSAWVFGKLVEDSSLITSDQWDAIYNSQSSDNDLPIVDEFKSESDMPEIGNSVADGGFALSKDSGDAGEIISPKDTVKAPIKIVKKKVKRYRKFGRDPFLPLDKSEFITPNLPALDNLTIVGIVYSETDAIALFEDSGSKGVVNSVSLRVGDHIKNGKVLQISENKVRFLIFESDFSYTVDKKLKDKKGN